MLRSGDGLGHLLLKRKFHFKPYSTHNVGTPYKVGRADGGGMSFRTKTLLHLVETPEFSLPLSAVVRVSEWVSHSLGMLC